MKYCSHCGAEIHDDAVVCVKCGCAVANINSRNLKTVDPDDAPSSGFAVLGFFFPMIGFILWLVWNDTSPKKAKSCGKGALIGFISGIVLAIILYAALFFGLFFFTTTNAWLQ